MDLGNEINGSNHDLGQAGKGRILTLEDLSSDPKGQPVAEGYLQYIKLLAVLKDIRDHSRVERAHADHIRRMGRTRRES